MDLGRHLLMDFYGCDRCRLDDSVYIEEQLRSAAKAAGAHVLSATVHRFSPQGVTGILSLRESHLAIHTRGPNANSLRPTYLAVALLTPGRPTSSLKKPCEQRAPPRVKKPAVATFDPLNRNAKKPVNHPVL